MSVRLRTAGILFGSGIGDGDYPLSASALYRRARGEIPLLAENFEILREKRELLRPARVGQRRLYGASDEIRLQLVFCGKRLGLSLREIEAVILARSEHA